MRTFFNLAVDSTQHYFTVISNGITSMIPTFRNLNSYYVIETNKLLRKMTSKKLSYASNQVEENIISTSEIIHDEFSSTTFNQGLFTQYILATVQICRVH